MSGYLFNFSLNKTQSNLLNQSILFYNKCVFCFEFESILDEYSKYPHFVNDFDFDSVLKSARLITRAMGELFPPSLVDQQRVAESLALFSAGDRVLNRQEANIVLDSLDFYERVIGLGQIEEVFSKINLFSSNRLRLSGIEAMGSFSHPLKRILWGHSPTSSFGIHSSSISDDFRVIYDMIQVLRYAIHSVSVRESESVGDEGTLMMLRYSVWSDTPRQTSKIPLPTCSFGTSF